MSTYVHCYINKGNSNPNNHGLLTNTSVIHIAPLVKIFDPACRKTHNIN